MFEVTEYDNDNFGPGRWSFYAPSASTKDLERWYSLDVSMQETVRLHLLSNAQLWFFLKDGAIVYLSLADA